MGAARAKAASRSLSNIIDVPTPNPADTVHPMGSIISLFGPVGYMHSSLSEARIEVPAEAILLTADVSCLSVTKYATRWWRATLPAQVLTTDDLERVVEARAIVTAPPYR